MIDIPESCSTLLFPPGCRRHEEDVPPCVGRKSKQWRIRHRSDDFQSWRLPEYVYDDLFLAYYDFDCYYDFYDGFEDFDIKEEVFCLFNDLVFPSDRPESATPKNVPRA